MEAIGIVTNSAELLGNLHTALKANGENQKRLNTASDKLSFIGEVLKGVAEGAGSGMAIGSLVPGYGNIIGAAIGAIVGGGASAVSSYFSGSKEHSDTPMPDDHKKSVDHTK